MQPFFFLPAHQLYSTYATCLFFSSLPTIQHLCNLFCFFHQLANYTALLIQPVFFSPTRQLYSPSHTTFFFSPARQLYSTSRTTCFFFFSSSPTIQHFSYNLFWLTEQNTLVTASSYSNHSSIVSSDENLLCFKVTHPTMHSFPCKLTF